LHRNFVFLDDDRSELRGDSTRRRVKRVRLIDEAEGNEEIRHMLEVNVGFEDYSEPWIFRTCTRSR
jgi:hypothetical protein